MSIEEKRREAFEEHARKKGLDLGYRNYPGIGQFYTCARTLLAWESWSAALDSVEIELPQPWTEAFMKSESMLQDCKFAIEACGLKVKV